MLELEGLLEIASEDGHAITVSADGSAVRAEIGTLTLRRPTLRLVGSGLVLARRLAKALDRQRLTLVVTRAGQPIVEMGAGVTGGPAARLLRMPRLRLYRRK